MRRSYLGRWLVTISTASLVVTLSLLSFASNASFDTDDSRGFGPPQPKAGLVVETPRRNLSELPPQSSNIEKGAINKSSALFNVIQEQSGDQQRDKRPNGLVYTYIPPPAINLTARSILSEKMSLANLTSSSNAALCAIVKDAEAYLDEWTDYHFGLGFHTIYLIDNSDSHELMQWQNKRLQAGYSVRVLPKPGSHRQMYGYHMCATEFQNRHTYMAFFDIDEFLVLKKHSTVGDFLVDHLPKGALSISWYIFGTSNRTTYSPLPVTKRFVLRDGITPQDRHSKWNNVKSILKLSDYGGYPKSPHSMKTNRKRTGSSSYWRDTNGRGSYDSNGSSNFERPVDVAVLHHYKYLSPKEFYWKSCVRKTVDNKFKDCDVTLSQTSNIYVGKIFDDSAWQTLKRNVPRYKAFDEFEDFM